MCNVLFLCEKRAEAEETVEHREMKHVFSEVRVQVKETLDCESYNSS